MDEVVDRLLAADELDNREKYQLGLAEGETWASEDARPRQLRNLEEEHRKYQRYSGIEGAVEVYAGSGNKGIAWHLANVLKAKSDEFDNRDPECFWEDALGDGGSDMIADQDFAKGFVTGALSIWEKAQQAARAKGKRL
jgi:hypothetical protein